MRRPNSLIGTTAAAFLASAVLWSPEARAQEDNAAKAAALAREGETLLAAGKLAEACDKYQESQTIDPRGGTVLDLALCREREGRIGTAYIHYDQAERAANAEKRSDRAGTAKAHKNALFLKVPKVTVNVPKEHVVPGLEVRIGLLSARTLNLVPESEWGKGVPADPGALKVMVTAPGRATWETTFDLKQGGRRTVTVPALAQGSGPPALPPDVPVMAPPDPPKNGGPTPPPGQPGQPAQPPGQARPPSAPGKHEGGRVVVDIGALVGAHLSLISQAPLSDINGTQYIYRGAEQSEFLASCGNTNAVPGAGACDATFNPQFGFAGGAQLFLGYAITDSVQFGGRFFGGAHFPVGFWVLGGPSISFQVAGPLWLGVNALVGTTQIAAVVTGGKGSVPESNVENNDGESQVDIPVEDLAGRSGETPFSTLDADGNPTATAGAFAGFEVGGSLELSIVLADNPGTDVTSGALMLSVWPTAMWAPGHGAALMVPVGLGYRFY